MAVEGVSDAGVAGASGDDGGGKKMCRRRRWRGERLGAWERNEGDLGSERDVGAEVATDTALLIHPKHNIVCTIYGSYDKILSRAWATTLAR